MPEIDERLARRLVDSQFPQWSDLPLRMVRPGGWDNRTFRLGDGLSVRLPSGDFYARAVAKEQRWLPVLAPRLPLPVPEPVGRGEPEFGYPYPWSVYRWLDGEIATPENIADPVAFATAVAGFLVALRGVDPSGGPGPGEHNWFRGGPVTYYADGAERAMAALGTEIPRHAVRRIWDEAVAAAGAWRGEPVWFHGDVAHGNLLVRDGALAAVIDFGTSGVGDPSCDVVIAWTMLTGRAREAFRTTLGADAGTWARGRGWGLWKAMIVLVGDLERGDDAAADVQRRVIAEIVADHEHTAHAG